MKNQNETQNEGAFVPPTETVVKTETVTPETSSDTVVTTEDPEAVPDPAAESTSDENTSTAMTVVHSQEEDVATEMVSEPVAETTAPDPVIYTVDPKHFHVEEIGTRYNAPVYHVVEGVGLQPLMHSDTGHQFYYPIPFVRGSKAPGGEDVQKHEGILTETLVAILKTDLEYKHGLVPSDETAAAIVHLTAVQDLLEARSKRRAAAGTQGTMKK